MLQRHLKLHSQQEAAATSTQQQSSAPVSGESGQSVLEEQPSLSNSEPRVLGAALASAPARTLSPELADQSGISQQDASAVSSSRPPNSVEWARSGVSPHAVSVVPESSRSRQKAAELATTPTPHWTFGSTNDIGLQTGMLYSSGIDNDYMQRQMMGNFVH